MVEFENDVIIVGGFERGSYSKALFKFSCANQKCKLNKMDQEFEVPRAYHVAITFSIELGM